MDDGAVQELKTSHLLERPKIMLDDEWYLNSKLRLLGLGVNLFSGVTDFEQRKEKARTAIKDSGISDKECWKLKGKPQTFKEAFRAAYNEEL
jgi:hypothetical protein